MVFESQHERDRLAQELRRLEVHDEVVDWLADPNTDLTPLARAAAVPFWDVVFRRYERRTRPPAVAGEPVFGLAMQAYLEHWQEELEQRELFAAAEMLARAAQEHLITRSHFGA
jgi:hypothetical protein